MTAELSDDQGGLFDVDALADRVAMRPGEVGRVEGMLRVALRAAVLAGVVLEEDLGMVAAALAGARALDVAERGGPRGGPYATAANLTPYREVLQALRLPAAVAPAEGGDVRPPGGSQGDVPSWLSDQFGTAE